MEMNEEFPVEIIIGDAGIAYIESGPSKAFINVVLSGDEEDVDAFNEALEKVSLKLIMTIGDGGLDTVFTVMSFGTVLETVSVSHALELSAQQRNRVHNQQE